MHRYFTFSLRILPIMFYLYWIDIGYLCNEHNRLIVSKMRRDNIYIIQFTVSLPRRISGKGSVDLEPCKKNCVKTSCNFFPT